MRRRCPAVSLCLQGTLRTRYEVILTGCCICASANLLLIVIGDAMLVAAGVGARLGLAQRWEQG